MIGVMSGTSMDGLDLAYVQFILKDKWFFKIIASETIPYSDSWRKVLKNLVFKSPVALEQIDQEYSIHISDLINLETIPYVTLTCREQLEKSGLPTTGGCVLGPPGLQKCYRPGRFVGGANILNQTGTLPGNIAAGLPVVYQM